MVCGAGYVEFDIRAARIADIEASVAQGPAEEAVADALDELSSLVVGAGSAKGSKFEILLDRNFGPSVLVGCPEDLGERAKNPECMRADIPVRNIQWRQRIRDATVMHGGHVSLDRSGRVVRVAGVLVDLTSVPAFCVSGDVADRIAVEFIRSARNQSDLKAKTRRRGKGLGRFLAIGNQSQLVPYWEVEVVITAPADLRGMVRRVRVDALTGKPESADYLEFLTDAPG